MPHAHAWPPHGAPTRCKRPHGSNRFFVTSPKAGRRIELWGIAQLNHWIELESDPAIDCLCERPLVIQVASRSRPVDFWVGGPRLSKYVVLVGQGATSLASPESAFPAFTAWAAEQGSTVETVTPAELTEDRERWYSNWVTVLQQMFAFRVQLTPELLATVRSVVASPVRLADVVTSLPNEDADLVRSAVYTLVHRGEISFVDLSKAILSDATSVAPP